METSTLDLLEALVEVGRSSQFQNAANLSGAGNHASVCRLAESSQEVSHYFRKLSENDRESLIKAIAIYENSVGGLGSVTLLDKLLKLVSDPDRTIFEWILANTHSYSYYAHGAKSLEEYDRICSLISQRRSENQKKEIIRELEAKLRKAARASENLFNAVRRGDIKAVRALVEKGANPEIKTSNGFSLVDYAKAIGRQDIADELIRCCPASE